MRPMDAVEYAALVGQWLCVLGMVIVLRTMLSRKATEKQKKPGPHIH